MIGWGDVYKVVVAMAPLYVALALGYGSVRWWRIFTAEQCDAVTRLVSFFALPFFTFDFASRADPFAWNYRIIAADALSKLLIVLSLAAAAKCTPSTKDGAYCWAITSFSLSTLTNSLVVGVPLLNAMYGAWAQDIVVQLSVVQAITWLTLLLFALELRKARALSPVVSSLESPSADKDAEGNEVAGVLPTRPPSFVQLMKVVWMKLALNPNTYASIVGISWAFIANRWHFAMPSIMEGSVQIMARAGTGLAMFSMGLFMAQQEKLVACGTGLTVFGMALRFIAGPAAMAVASIAVGIHGDLLRVAVMQAAVPQSITSFIFAREYRLHADVISTAVIFGMLVALPILVAYYVVLGFVS